MRIQPPCKAERSEKQNTLSTKLETFLLDLKEGATATVLLLFCPDNKEKNPS